MSENKFDSSKAKEIQLTISLKFHHSKILSEMSLESAISAMTQAWQSCQDTQHDQHQGLIENSEETIIVDRQEFIAGDPPLDPEG